VTPLRKPFEADTAELAKLAPESAATLLTITGDITLMLDRTGVIRKLAFGSGEHSIDDSDDWVGRRWVDTVPSDSRAKVELMLREVAASGASQRRQVNHPSGGGADVPVSYTAVRLGQQGEIAAVGRDLRIVSSLQRRLVETQQAMERDYWRMRHVETRYRLLFQFSSDAILVVDAATLRILDCNAAAAELLGHSAEGLMSKTFPIGLAPASARAVGDLLASARATGRADGSVRVSDLGNDVALSVSCFRQDSATLFLLRFAPQQAAERDGARPAASLLQLIESAPDGVVVTDLDGTIQTANRAFLDIAQLTTDAQAAGRPLSDWVGRPGADLPVFLGALKKHGAVRLVSTSARGDHGATTEVEISATWIPQGRPPCIGFIIRDVGRRVVAGPQGARDLTRAVEQLTGLVGRVAMRDLIRDTSDLVERHFIEAALELTGQNRTAAAEVLGLSRQSLYVKLRRHGLQTPDDASPDVAAS
jgi:transcriptional regulator PpsR